VGALLNLWLVAALIGAAAQIKSTEGVMLRPLEPSGAANVLLFVATDCPIANGYAPEIQRMCKAYAPSGVRCQLIYEDVGVAAETVRRHLAEYGYSGATAAIDGDAAIAKRVNATVNPRSGRHRSRRHGALPWTDRQPVRDARAAAPRRDRARPAGCPRRRDRRQAGVDPGDGTGRLLHRSTRDAEEMTR